MQHWKAHYKDEKHDENITIINSEADYHTEPLSFELDGISFQGTSLGDLHLADEEQYTEAREKFCILKWGGNHWRTGEVSPYGYDLQRYGLDIDIPVIIVRKRDCREIIGKLHLAFEYVECDRSKHRSRYMCDDIEVFRDDTVVSDFSVHVGNEVYGSARKTLYFESALADISARMKEHYYIKTCFTCQYSDYSPYGNDDYGTMLCYRKYKAECLKVHNKDDYFKFLEDKDFDARQETYLCDEYRKRNVCGGYRGFVDGIV